MTRSIQIIANGHAKTAADPASREAFVAAVRQELPDAKILFTDKGTNVFETARAAVHKGMQVVVAGGGDGTVNAVASALIDTEAVLGVLPLGTLNHFAHDVGIPVEVPEALRVISLGNVTKVDVGTVNNRIFVNNSGLGLYPDIVYRREQREQKGASKWPSAVLEGVRAFLRYRLLTLGIEVEGRQLRRRTPAVFVGNNEYTMEGTIAAKRVDLTGGTLCLYIPHPSGRLRMLWFSLRALFSNPEADGEFDRMLAREFTIESRHRRLRVSIDGEVTVMQTPLRYASYPAKLNVLTPVPQSAPESGSQSPSAAGEGSTGSPPRANA